jgi:hypothetical protein
MKKIFSLLIVVLMTTIVQASPLQNTASARRVQMIERYLKQRVINEDFPTTLFLAARKGDTQAISSWAQQATNGAPLLRTDKFGNNLFHVAKDASTVQALAAAVRTLYKTDYAQKIAELKNQRNKMGETPLMMHISYGRTDTFYLFYSGSLLELAIENVQSVDKGGSLSNVAEIRKDEVRRLAQDNSGRNFCQSARDGISYYPNLQEVVSFCAVNVSYL